MTERERDVIISVDLTLKSFFMPDIQNRKEWTVDEVAAIGDLPDNPRNGDLVDYALRNGLLRQGEGVMQLLQKAERKLDPLSIGILKAVIDGNERNKKGRNLALAGAIRGERFRVEPPRPIRNPRKFRTIAKNEINDLMGAWITTERGDILDWPGDRPLTSAYRSFRDALDKKLEGISQVTEICQRLGDSGLRRMFVQGSTDRCLSLDDRRATTYSDEKSRGGYSDYTSDARRQFYAEKSTHPSQPSDMEHMSDEASSEQSQPPCTDTD